MSKSQPDAFFESHRRLDALGKLTFLGLFGAWLFEAIRHHPGLRTHLDPLDQMTWERSHFLLTWGWLGLTGGLIAHVLKGAIRPKDRGGPSSR